MPSVVDHIIESYEWLMMHAEGSARDVDKWHKALFYLEELKQIRKLGRVGCHLVFTDASSGGGGDDSGDGSHFTIDKNGNGAWMTAGVAGGLPASSVIIGAEPPLLVVFGRLLGPVQLQNVRADVRAYLESNRQALLLEGADAVYQCIGGRWLPVFIAEK